MTWTMVIDLIQSGAILYLLSRLYKKKPVEKKHQKAKKELRLTRYDVMKFPSDSVMATFILNNKLRVAGFNMNKEIVCTEDPLTGDFIYTQK